MNISSVSDSEILQEYVKRFTIQAGESIRSAREAAAHFRAYFSEAAKHEMFVCCYLNGQHQILTTEVMMKGSLSTSAVYPREIVARVIELGANSVMFAHNHPSGSITPSNSDRAVTKKLSVGLTAIDVDVLDHIIIGGSEHFSFADHSLL
jgi:DNA repair protein RadC